MADFLSSFNFNSPGAEPQEESSCVSIEDVRARLQKLLDGKVSSTRAERIDAAIEIAKTAQFAVPKDQRDTTDPTTLITEVVSVSHLLANQPQYDPAMQTAVTKLLVAAIGEVDSSSWTVKDITRQTQGWVFAYECRDSWQHWSRRGRPIKSLPIAECSQKGPDDTTGARPAFDCRGYLTISFLRNKKAISISYAHTPIHRTVSQAYEYFKPAPPPSPPVAENREPPMAKKPRKSDGSKRKRPTANGVNDDGTSKKKKTKRKSTKAGTVSHAELVLVGTVQDTENLESVAQTAHDMANGVATGHTATNNEPALRTTFNVSPEEAARRQAAAKAKLQEAGVDPNSLSADQFNIFSNQSPEVQKESLNMLAKYGAERLRIVQPANRDSPATSSTATPAETASGKGKGAATRQANGRNGLDNLITSEQIASETPQKKAKKPGKSRLVCFSCKGSRTNKCSKDRPTCEQCAAAGNDCEYPPQKPRSRKSAATVAVEEEEGQEEDDEAEGAEGEPSTAEDNTYNEADELPEYPTAPIANMLTTNADDANRYDSPAYGNHPLSPQAMPLPHADPLQPFQLHPSGTTSSGLALPQGRTYYQPYVSPTAGSASPYAAPSQIALAADSVHTAESSISPHLTMQNNTPKPASGTKQNHPPSAHRSRAGYNNRPSDGGLQLPLGTQATQSPNIGHSEPATTQISNSGPYQGYPELGGQSGAYYTAQGSSSRIAYQPYLHSKSNDNNTARHSLPDQQRRSMVSPHGHISVRPPPSDGVTQNYAGNNRQSVNPKQSSPYMRQNTHQGTQSPLALPSLSQRKQETQSPAAAGQQRTSYGTYSYTQSNQQSQQGGSGWYGTNNQGGTNQSPNYSWGMHQEGWSRMQ